MYGLKNDSISYHFLSFSLPDLSFVYVYVSVYTYLVYLPIRLVVPGFKGCLCVGNHTFGLFLVKYLYLAIELGSKYFMGCDLFT